MRRQLVPYLFLSIAACTPDGPAPESSLDSAENAAEAVEDVTGLGLVPRDGWGPFTIRTAPSAETGSPAAVDIPSSEWACASKNVYAQPAEVLILWRGCRVDSSPRLEDASAYAGDFDVAASFRRQDDASVDLDLWLDNRLAVGIERFRYVMRIDPATLPTDSGQIRAQFGYDDYITDPLSSLRELPANAVWRAQVASSETDERFFVRNRVKVTSMLSLHTPDWGYLIHTTDPDNADTGWLVLGSNPDDDGRLSLEVGYEYRVPGAWQPGNGTAEPMKLGPTLRGEALPAERSLDSAWWEAVDAYVPFLEDETDLLPGFDLATAPYPAAWAQQCLYTVWNIVGSQVDSDTPYAAYAQPFLDRLADVARAYAREDGAMPVICPLLWDFHTYAPHTPHVYSMRLLEDLHALADDLGVELHPGTYYLPWSTDYDRARVHPTLKDAMVLKANGEPDLGLGDNGTIHVRLAQDHPAVKSELRDTLRFLYDNGLDWAYHDNPFAEMRDFNRFAAIDRQTGANSRALIQMMANELTELGGGIVGQELGRLGLNTLQAGSGGVTGGLLPGAEFSAAVDALFHGRHATGFAGSIGGESLSFVWADERAVPIMCAVHAAQNKPPPCPYTKGQKGNADYMAHIAMTAAYGRLIIDPMPNIRDLASISPAWSKTALEGYQTALRNAYWLRRELPILRTGRLRPPPPTVDNETVTFSTRRQTKSDPHDSEWEAETGGRTLPRYPTGFFEDLNQPGRYVLVVGNPEPADAEVTFILDADTYSGLQAETAISDDGSTLTLRVPALGFTAVELRR